MESLISVADKNGMVYSMPSKTARCILEIHYSTSYLQFVVQDERKNEDGTSSLATKNVFVTLNTENWVDWLAVNSDDVGKLIGGKV